MGPASRAKAPLGIGQAGDMADASWPHSVRALHGAQGKARLVATLEELSARLDYLRWSLEPPGTVAPGSEPRDGDWLACDELVTVPGWAKQVVLATGRQLGTESPAVACSLFVLGYAYRVLVFAIGCLTIGGIVPPSDANAMAMGLGRARASLVGYRHLSVLDLQVAPDAICEVLAEAVPREVALGAVLDQAISRHLGLLIQALTAEIRVGRRLLWGNVAASAAVAFRTVEGLLGPWVRPLAEAFFRQAPVEMRGQGSFFLLEVGGRRGWFWERTNCCLNDRLPQKIRCADCSKTPVEERRAAYRRSLFGAEACQ